MADCRSNLLPRNLSNPTVCLCLQKLKKMNSRNKKLFFELFDENFESLNDEKETIVVVTFFGKSFWDSDGCKYDGFKALQKKDVKDPYKPEVDGLYNPDQRVIYLQIRGVFDVRNLVNTISSSSKELNEKGYLSMWADLKIAYAETLFLLVSISHIVVLCHPVAVFDTSYLQLFRALDAAREKHRSDCAQAINELKIELDSKDNGRFCPPRLLFHFLSSPKQLLDFQGLEHSLEDQIYQLLKQHKFVVYNNNPALFSIPANQEFVFVENSPTRPGARIINSAQDIIKQCMRPQPSTRVSFSLNRLNIENDLQESNPHTFDKFLKSHIDVVLSKGVDDVGRHSKSACFLPTPKQWVQIAKAINSQINAKQTLTASLDIDRKFSEGRCAKVLPLALAAYQDNAPPHYPRRYHESKLAQALAVLAMHGRGAMLDKYVSVLEKQCNDHWKNGRQMCETLSLTGHPCVNAIHKGGGEGAGGGELTEEDKKHNEERFSRKLENLEEKEHCSGIRYLSACNCGKKQGHRSDPYTLKSANFEFYRSLATECGCEKLESFKFPVFQPSVKDFRAAQLLGRRESLALLRGDFPRSQLAAGTQHEAFSLAFVSGPSVHGSCDVVETRLSCLRTQHPDILILTNQPGDQLKDKGLVRQASTTEYLPGMLHAESPTGLLPQFASWSLICVGASSVYSHSLGLNEQPGLISGSSHLMLWDVTVRLEHSRKNVWPAVTDTKRGGSQQRVRKNKGEQSEMIVKIFIGVEYECTRGHRFMAASPDKVLKTGPSGQVRDTGHKLASSDMPLYFPCPCSKPNKPVVAQLMRLHVVTPKAPVRVTLNPRVQPAPNAPVFVACQDQPIPLTQSTYWVCRLPYVYMAERAPFVAPLEIPGPMYGRLLLGTFGITEIPPERQ